MANEKNELSLELRPEVATGTYSNLAIITHSHSEFIIDLQACSQVCRNRISPTES